MPRWREVGTVEGLVAETGLTGLEPVWEGSTTIDVEEEGLWVWSVEGCRWGVESEGLMKKVGDSASVATFPSIVMGSSAGLL